MTLSEINLISSQVAVLKKELEKFEAILSSRRNDVRPGLMNGKEESDQVQNTGKMFISNTKQTMQNALSAAKSKGSDVKSWFKNKLGSSDFYKVDTQESGVQMELQPIKSNANVSG